MAETVTKIGVGSKFERVSRYPGVQPFGDDEIQRQLFKGRDEEKYELLQLVLAERLVLIFARSGIGKSSLINAGLLEPMRDKGYFPAVVRVSGKGRSPLDSLYEGIKAAVDKAREQGRVECEPPEPEWNKTSLWHFFKTLELWQKDTLLSPVLVIDQFEELFTLHSVEQRKQFIHELADLVRGTRPRETSNESGQKLGDTPPEVKVVLSLREDFYANLEELRDRIPSIYKAPFRLKPLSREQAARAIVEPAELEGRHFWTPAFKWSDEALKAVLDFLSEQQLGEGKTKVGKEVEPFQLQLVCQHVEGMVRQEKLQAITPDKLDGDDVLKVVLSSFYEDTLRKICERFPQESGLRERLERLCEYGFITARGRRLLREESTIKQDDGVGPEVLRELVELRLLRIEPRVGDNYYELTHDTLIEPIQLSRQAREERKAQEAREAQKKVRRQFMAAGVFAAFVLIATSMWALWERAETRRVAEAKELARAAQREAEQTAQRAVLKADRAVAEKQQAVAEKQASVKVAVKARLEAGEEEARRRLAEAEAKMAETKAPVDAAQKRVAEARVQATEAEGQDYEEDANQLVAVAEAELRELAKQLEKVRKAVYQAKTKVTLAEAKREATEVRQQVVEIDGAAEAVKTGDVPVEAEDVLAESERQAVVLEARLAETATPEAGTSSVAAVESTVVEDKTELKARARVDLAALEFRETEPEVTDDELAKQYREFLGTHGNSLGAEEVQNIEGRMSEIEEAAVVFADLKQKDSDPNFSVCEAFDQWTAFEPRRSLGPEAQFRDLRLAELNALLQDSVVVSTQKNFITSRGESDLDARSTFALGKDRVYMHMWVNAPRSEAVKLKVRQGDTESVIWSGKRVGKNPLKGHRIGYHLWTYKGANAVGEYELLLYNSSDRLICRLDYEIVAMTQ